MKFKREWLNEPYKNLIELFKFADNCKDNETPIILSDFYDGGKNSCVGIYKNHEEFYNEYLKLFLQKFELGEEELDSFKWFIETSKEEREKIKLMSEIDYHTKELERLKSKLTN